MATKTVGIDIREANGLGAGKGRYTEEITKALIEAAPELEFFLFTNKANPRFKNSDRVHQIIIKGKGPFWHLNLKRYIDHHPVDFFIAPTSYIYPAIAPTSQKIALIVHDLIAFKYAKFNHWFATLVERLTLGRAIKHSDLIVTVSNHTWQDLKQIKPEAVDKSHVVSTPAIGPEIQAVSDWKLMLPPRFLLAVGTVQPRKNIQGVIEAFAQLKQPDLHLVIAGGKGWKTSRIFRAIPDQLKSRIHFLGYVEHEQLMELYSRAEMLVFPSFYEGFGIPPLEAMACGCPVITSNVSSLPEVVEDAAIVVDPTDTNQLTTAIQNMLDPQTQQMAKERGTIQAQKFSWEMSATKLLMSIRKLSK